MLGRTNNQRYLLWQALGTATMALAMASLLVFELAQKRAIDQSNAIRSDSLTALAFQFEREFLRTRQALALTLAKPEASDVDALSLRYDIFLSRLTLLREAPSVSLLTARPEYRKVMPRLEPLVADMDRALAAKVPDRKVLAQALAVFEDLGTDVQAMSLAANSEVARLLEQQTVTMRDQNVLIVWLTLAQLALLVIASGALVLRQKRLEAERVALEQLTDELREARKRAEAANRGKSQFLANMSHELRTPFNGLMGMLGLLQTSAPTPQQADFIETAQGSASHLLTLLNDILDSSALETGNITLKPVHLDLKRLLREVNALMQPLARQKGLTFEIRQPELALPVVLADETRVKQILFNLVSNAIKFTASGQVLLSVAAMALSGNMVKLVFDIQDSGIGMDASVLSRLFQRFYQVDDSSTRRFGGTGLGLEISQSLARMMNGEITVRSEVGVGSTFTASLHLPLGDASQMARSAVVEEMPSVPILQTPALPQSVAQSSQTSAKGLRVLVVEDHPINQKLVGVLLARMECQVSYCENGEQAVQQVQQQPYDLILMDVNMPIMDGLVATRRIRALPTAAARIPIVVVTADVMNEAQAQALSAGANDFISKPVKLDQLRSVVAKYAASRVV
jgi:signal transduction histidine kinase/ActR/RegA family two-component response regulator